jgi:TorA maturation chaperone TorD
MREQGLSEAIRAVGGVSELARRIGIAQPSVSNWQRIPAERVLAVESATGIGRAVLRPDLYGDAEAERVDECDAARAREYGLLAALLARAPDADFLERLVSLPGDASPLGVAHAALGEAASRTNADRLQREYFDLFIGLGRGELLPYGSYYLSGFLHERPLARLREDLAEMGVAWTRGSVEPEDHAATLCELMAGVVSGTLTTPKGSDRRLFDWHLAPWLGRFFTDLEYAPGAEFYAAVGAFGRMFIEIERRAFARAEGPVMRSMLARKAEPVSL